MLGAAGRSGLSLGGLSLGAAGRSGLSLGGLLLSGLSLGAVLLAASACDPQGSEAKKDPAAPVAASGSASAGSLASVKAPPKPAPPPTWKVQKIDGGEHTLTGIYKLRNGVAVTNDKKKVGHLTDKGIEWLDKKMPASIRGLGETQLRGVHGSWPDNIYVEYVSSEGRAPEPTLWPLTGKGASFKLAEGGGWGTFGGFVEYGESTIVLGESMAAGVQYRTVRGPGVPLITTKAEAEGCQPRWPGEATPAIDPSRLEVTPAGTFIAIGVHCKDHKTPYAEVWKSPGQGKLVKLSAMTDSSSSPVLIRGKGDELFVQPNSASPNRLLRFKDGAFSQLPVPRWLVIEVFGDDGELLIFDGKAVRKLTGDQWKVVAYLDGDTENLRGLIMHQGTLYGSQGGAVKLVPSDNQVEHADECKPLVYMYQASWKNNDTFTYPSTRKAVSSFAAAAEVELMEFKRGYSKHVAVAVKSDEQGEALIKHLKTAMPDEKPYIVCYEPKDKRTISLKP